MTTASDLRESPSTGVRTRAAWLIAVALGLALLGYGVVGQSLTLQSPRWGNPDWEVAYFGEFSATLSLMAMGLAVVVCLGLTTGRRGISFGLAVVLALLGSWALLGAVLVGLDIPLVLEAARSAGSVEQATGLKVVTAKALALCGLYAVGFIGIAGFMLRTSFRRGARSV